jgi:C4-dicarboxylate-specific signal transduction histidine kinase
MSLLEKEVLDYLLRQTNRAFLLRQVIGGVTHKINSALANISSSLELLIEYIKKGVAGESHVKQVIEYVFSCKDAYLRLVKFIEGKEKASSININHVLKDAIELVNGKAREANIQVRWEFAENPPLIIASRARLQEVFVNIMLCSIYLIKKRGEIKIKTACNNKGVNIQITDTSRGVSRRMAEKMLAPQPAEKRQPEDMAFNLYFSKQYINSLGGAMAVEIKPGRGAKYVVSIPVRRR